MGNLTITIDSRKCYRIMEDSIMPAIVEFPTVVKEALRRGRVLVSGIHRPVGGDDEGIVEFSAFYVRNGLKDEHRETAE